MEQIVVIGVGNSLRGDDGVGLAVAERVRALAPTDVTVLAQSGEGASLMAAWAGATHVFLVDAAVSGAAPGVIHRLDVGERPLPAIFRSGFSSHAFGVAAAIKLGRAMNNLPPHLVIFAVEGESFTLGQETLTPTVNWAADQLARQILAEIEQINSSPTSTIGA